MWAMPANRYGRYGFIGHLASIYDMQYVTCKKTASFLLVPRYTGYSTHIVMLFIDKLPDQCTFNF